MACAHGHGGSPLRSTLSQCLDSSGSGHVDVVQYQVGYRYAHQDVRVTCKCDRITVANTDGEVIIEHTRAPHGVAYVSNRAAGPRTRAPRRPRPGDLDENTHLRRVQTNGSVSFGSVHYMADRCYARQEVLVIADDDKITICNHSGEILAEHTRPVPGTTYVTNSAGCHHPAGREPSPKS